MAEAVMERKKSRVGSRTEPSKSTRVKNAKLQSPCACKKAVARKKMHNKELGARGEEVAVDFLRRRGFSILERNWTCFAGEADIIALDDEAIHFIEVKTRRGDGSGFAAEAVDAAADATEPAKKPKKKISAEELYGTKPVAKKPAAQKTEAAAEEASTKATTTEEEGE